MDAEKQWASEGEATSWMHVDKQRIGKWFSLMLYFLLGLSSWLLVNGAFLELPILFMVSPEGYAIASYIVLAVQVGNIFPVLYVYAFPQVEVTIAIGVNLLVTELAAVLLIFFWDAVAFDHSVGLIVLSAVAGGVGSMSMVTLFSFASRASSQHMTAAAAGVSFNGLLGSVIALIQQPGKSTQRFGATTFFGILAAFILLSVFAFAVILYRTRTTTVKALGLGNDSIDSAGGGQYVAGSSEEEARTIVSATMSSSSDGEESGSVGAYERVPDTDVGMAGQLADETDGEEDLPREVMLTIYGQYAHIALINALKFCILGMYAYSVACYGNGSTLVLWMNIIGLLCDSCGRTFGPSLPHVPTSWFMIVLQSATWGYLMIMVFLGARTPLPGPWGGWVLVFLYGAYNSFFGYDFTIIFVEAPKISRHKAERVCQQLGLWNQAGACVGSIVSFLLVKYVPVFQTFDTSC
eukprot:CAMPEP_0119124066 /NCGR_PEP_ID=MMETSP1310-20130426/3796_1 /TAXON_ID=464262 /ORGANISM="Genus nov. species nov., Strain RCC2339" /LENGTH=464 /DNA_ID=CAMNT_0007113955 /DNA_START=135 /DNA_END=1529 /DNA_ORIENTATION=+